uniref:Nucleotide-binding, alpha-beta plait n=1 Tax=Tanacetum cinerariifolium TaxID=118510 RepID=A0A6L2NHB4_TANCI|nr:nucleotide-binding, alpha-beta plait [Tanacetum cinerariifolium]
MSNHSGTNQGSGEVSCCCTKWIGNMTLQLIKKKRVFAWTTDHHRRQVLIAKLVGAARIYKKSMVVIPRRPVVRTFLAIMLMYLDVNSSWTKTLFHSTKKSKKSVTKKSKGFAFVHFASVDQAMRALSELNDGVEVRGKLIKISKSQNNKMLFLGNITWSKEEVLQELVQYGIEHIEMIRVPEDIAYNKKVKVGDTKRLAKDWNEEKVKEIFEKYGEIVNIDLHQSSKPKHKDFGFAVKVNPPRVSLM